MKKWIFFGAAAFLALTLCVVFGNILTAFFQPMEDITYDLSMFYKGEGILDDWVYDQKGWTVFVQEGETVTELIPDGYGSFSSLDEPGQTFYFSRVLTEELDSPTLYLETANRTFSVFLDGTLIYTDCPELDNRIGYLRLPMLEWDRGEPVLVKLPLNYAGKTLTIAQSTSPLGGEKQEPDMTVFPAGAALYCGYAYESGLISESFQTAFLSLLSYLAGLVLLALFLWQAFQGRLDPGTLCGALAAFSYLTACISGTSFWDHFFDFQDIYIDAGSFCRDLTLLMLLVMLLCKLSGRRRVLAGLFAGALGVMVVVRDIVIMKQQLAIAFTLIASVVPAVELMALAVTLVCGVLEWKQNWFFRVFCPLTAAGVVLGTMLGYLHLQFLWSAMELPGVLSRFLSGIVMAAALTTALAEAVCREITRRTETRLLVQRSELDQSSYESMRRQNEQVMMLRHDMMKHFQVLRQTTTDEKTAAYLDGLIGENEKIRPVVQSGNEMLDVILNSKLSAAADAGIAVEIARMNAPDKLSLSDSELCSLVMNLLDNALEAAAVPGVKRRYINLDLHIRNNFFVFTCENGATPDWISKETAPERGLGLKVIRQIVERHGNLSKAERGDDYYKVTVALSLRQPSK